MLWAGLLVSSGAVILTLVVVLLVVRRGRVVPTAVVIVSALLLGGFGAAATASAKSRSGVFSPAPVTTASSTAQATPNTETPRAPAPSWMPVPSDGGAGYPGFPRWSVPEYPAGLQVTSSGMPRSGAVGSVVIPAVRSHFRARPAVVYLPPVALTGHPPRLPVVIALSGQSRGAGPTDVFSTAARKGALAEGLNRFAAAHQGWAPIVIVPDQLGYTDSNPMCVDSATYGHVASYLLGDVRDWIRLHLPVRTDRGGWAVAGFSEGGTCSIQFGAGHPDLFGSLIDVSGEQAPENGSIAHTLATGFGGDRDAFAEATPFRLLAHHRYHHLEAYFAAGALDAHYGPIARAMAEHAREAGMSVHETTIPGQGHNWHVGASGLMWGISELCRSWQPD